MFSRRSSLFIFPCFFSFLSFLSSFGISRSGWLRCVNKHYCLLIYWPVILLRIHEKHLIYIHTVFQRMYSYMFSNWWKKVNGADDHQWAASSASKFVGDIYSPIYSSLHTTQYGVYGTMVSYQLVSSCV